jgi:hypothetical protein
VSIADRVMFGAIVIPLAPLMIFVFAFVLWSAYNFAPKKLPVREVLDGLFGLGGDQGSPSSQGTSAGLTSVTNQTKPSEVALVAEYQSLSLFINSRRTQQMAINGITITGAIGILTFALSQSNSLGQVRGWIALFPIPLILLAWINWRGLVLVDDYSYKRVHQIEEIIGVYGHRGIVRHLEGNRLYRARYWFWDALYAIVFAVSVATSYYLFH